MGKNIYLEPDEEIISVVDRLVQTESDQINFVVPAGAQIWQSSINLKLLKREADNLNKSVTLIVADDLGAEMAERIGFAVKRERDFPIELVREQKEEMAQEERDQEEPEEDIRLDQSKENMIDRLVEELEPEKKITNPFSLLASWRKKPRQRVMPDVRGRSPQKKMADIVTPSESRDVKVKFFRPHLPKKESVIKKEPIPEPMKVEQLPQEKAFSAVQASTGSRWSKFFIIFIILAFLTAGLVAYLALPTTEITIYPKREKVTFDLSVVGSKNISQIDASLNKIPLQEVEVKKTKSREFPATGEKEINEKARGMITIYNEYSSSPQTLVATTRFESTEGKIFRIPKSVTVPGAKIEEGKIIPSTIKVEVVADQPGEDYNIGPSNFTIPGFKGTPKFAGFYGKSDDSMSGGYVGKVKIVLAKDLEEAESTLVNELKDEVKRALKEQIPTDLQIIENGLKEEVTKISSDVKAGEQAEQFTLEVSATMRALLFKEEDLKNLVDLNLISQISEDKEPLSQTQKISWVDPVIDWSKGGVSLSLEVEEDIVWKIDIQALKAELADLNEVEVRKYLANQPEIERAKVSFWPFWVKKIPSQEKKIKINIEL
jgi:septum formation topological specificity factor MinE